MSGCQQGPGPAEGERRATSASASTSKPLCRWEDEGISYSLWPVRGGPGAVLFAFGPGIRIRVAKERLTDAGVAEWLTLTEAEQTARAETLLRRQIGR